MIKKFYLGIFKRNLEKRIFVLFFIITFIMVALIILVEWQMVKFAILQNEDKEMNLALNTFQIKHNKYVLNKYNLLDTLTKDPKILHLLKTGNDPAGNDSEIKKYVSEKYDLSTDLELVIFAKNRKIISGTSWELIIANTSVIFQQSLVNQPGSFFSHYGKKLYELTFVPVFTEIPIYDLEGVILITERAENVLATTAFNSGLKLLTIDEIENESINNEELSDYSTHLINELSILLEEKKKQAIIRLSSSFAVAVVLNYDLRNNPAAILYYPYDRNVNQFAEQSIILFFLILIFITLLMIILLGNWFSNSILEPVKKISARMQNISAHPDHLEPLPLHYTGVLGDMVTTFNSMNISLNDYSNNLKEFKAITESLSSGIFWLDEDFQILLCNPELHKIFHVKAGKLLGQNINRFLNLSEDYKNIALHETLTLTSYEAMISGYKRYLLINIRPVKVNNKIKLVGNITDISKGIKEKQAREALEMELIKSNKLAEIGRRIEGIVHNINSPLNSILGYSQLIRKVEGYPRDVDKILESGKNIAHYVKGLLNKIKQGNISMMRPINVNEMILSELELCQHNLFYKHYVVLTTDFAADLPPVKAVYGDISLCIANLINNSIEAMQNTENKDLAVRTYCSESMVAIEIKDSGEGIAPKNLSKVFEPYFSTKIGKDSGGFGLGLAIAKNIINKYQGKLNVISELDVGTTFTIFLPIG